MNCEFCQSPAHIWFQCPRKPDGWKPARLAKKSRLVIPDQHVGMNTEPSTAARKDVRVPEPSVLTSRKAKATLPGSTPGAGMANDVAASAGTQALPVEPNNGVAQKAERRSPKPDVVGSNSTAIAKFDRQAWMREYMRTYMRDRRAKLKAQRES